MVLSVSLSCLLSVARSSFSFVRNSMSSSFDRNFVLDAYARPSQVTTININKYVHRNARYLWPMYDSTLLSLLPKCGHIRHSREGCLLTSWFFVLYLNRWNSRRRHLHERVLHEKNWKFLDERGLRMANANIDGEIRRNNTPIASEPENGFDECRLAPLARTVRPLCAIKNFNRLLFSEWRQRSDARNDLVLLANGPCVLWNVLIAMQNESEHTKEAPRPKFLNDC